MEEKDYPSLYQSANQASINTQKWYLRSITFYLICLIIGSAISQFAPKVSYWSIIATIVLLVTLGLSIFQAFKRYDVIWYNGRAVAESVKTRTWRFIMQAEPFNTESGSYQDIAKKFTHEVGEILRENRELGNFLTDECKADCITPKMLSVRNSNVQDRKNFYKEKRVNEQRKWYAEKAKWNNVQSIIWFALMIAANALAIIFTVVRIYKPAAEGLPIDIFITTAGAALTWMQVKRFQELSTSYNLTAHEISIFSQNIDFCITDQELSDFVKDAENAFSREHTQWVARKDK